MSWQSTLRKIEAAQRRSEREAVRKQSDISRRQKQQAKLNLLEQAALEVESYENQVEILLSMHKEASERFDWSRLSHSIPKAPPIPMRRRETKVTLEMRGKQADRWTPAEIEAREAARAADQREHFQALAEYEVEAKECSELRSLAHRVLNGDLRAYEQAVSEISPLSELANLGSDIGFTVHTRHMVECDLTVNGTECIPKETKSLTKSGKVTTKAMPKARFHEIYQDYVCGCVIRAARELLSLLPVESVIVTAKVSCQSPKTGLVDDLPVISIAAPRSVMDRLNFFNLDPSDAMENFLRRGDAKASKGSGVFVPITPLNFSDLQSQQIRHLSLLELISRSQHARAGICEVLARFTRTAESLNRIPA